MPQPTPVQIREAIRNPQRPPRTAAAKVRDALEHVKSTAESDGSPTMRRLMQGAQS